MGFSFRYPVSMAAWRDWYHVTGNTYGAWLPGDDRGWRTRHARTQPGADRSMSDPERGRLRKHVSDRLRREPVTLTPVAQQLARDTILAALQFHSIEVVVVAVTAVHFQILARFPHQKPRHWVGIAKKESARALSRHTLVVPGGTWAVRTHCNPISDRPHQMQVVRYTPCRVPRSGAVRLHDDPEPMGCIPWFDAIRCTPEPMDCSSMGSPVKQAHATRWLPAPEIYTRLSRTARQCVYLRPTSAHRRSATEKQQRTRARRRNLPADRAAGVR